MSQQLSQTLPTPATSPFVCNFPGGGAILGLQVLNDSDAPVDVFVGQQGTTNGAPSFSVPANTYLASLVPNASNVTLRFNSLDAGSVYVVWLDSPVVSLASGIPTAPPSTIPFEVGVPTITSRVVSTFVDPDGVTIATVQVGNLTLPAKSTAYRLFFSSIDVAGIPDYVTWGMALPPAAIGGATTRWQRYGSGPGHVVGSQPYFQSGVANGAANVALLLCFANYDNLAQFETGALAALVSGYAQ